MTRQRLIGLLAVLFGIALLLGSLDTDRRIGRYQQMRLADAWPLAPVIQVVSVALIVGGVFAVVLRGDV